MFACWTLHQKKSRQHKNYIVMPVSNKGPKRHTSVWVYGTNHEFSQLRCWKPHFLNMPVCHLFDLFSELLSLLVQVGLFVSSIELPLLLLCGPSPGKSIRTVVAGTSLVATPSIPRNFQASCYAFLEDTTKHSAILCSTLTCPVPSWPDRCGQTFGHAQGAPCT